MALSLRLRVDRDERQCHRAAVAVARLAAAAREVKEGLTPPAGEETKHRGGHDGGAGTIGLSFNKGGTGGIGTRRVVPEGVDAACQSKMAPWAIERAERAGRRRGGGGSQGGRRTGARLR